MKTVTVLGGGIQGTCASLALAAKGWRVQLIDQQDDLMLRASLRNEGKIHLGFTYANDVTMRTSQLMLESAVRFAPLIDHWSSDPFDWDRHRSPPFTYLIMRDSMRDTDQILSHYAALATAYEAMGTTAGHYLGEHPRALYREIPVPDYVNREMVAGAVESAERSVDLAAVRDHLRRLVESADQITTHFDARARQVSRTPAGFETTGTHRDGTAWAVSADGVVNCLWEGRLEIDETLGIRSDRPWAYRLKYRVLGELPDRLKNLPSLTMILGLYGDVVPMGRSSYFSWYPVCRQGWSDELVAPAEWQDACNGVADPENLEQLPGRVFENLDRVIPGVAESRAGSVDAGIIVSWGAADIDDPDSELHARFQVGVHEYDGYFSVDTGKYGCAPGFADDLARLL